MTGVGTTWLHMESESLKNGYEKNRSLNQRPPTGGTPDIPTPNAGRKKEFQHLSGTKSGSALSLSMSLPPRRSTQRTIHNSTSNIRSIRGSGRDEPLLERSGTGSGREEEGNEIMLNEYSPEEQEGRRRGPTRQGQINQSQEDAWGDAATAVTGNTSDRSNSPIGNSNPNPSIKWAHINQDDEHPPYLGWFQRYFGSYLSAFVVLISLSSPILMVMGPKLRFPSSWRPSLVGRECGTECHALLLSLAIKVVGLCGAVWAIFWRGPPATMPRIHFFRSITLLLAILATFIFWLFYWVRGEEDLSTLGAIAFAGGLADSLLFIHYLGVLLTEIRHISPIFQISILRSPDGIEKSYLIGSLSIQRAAVYVLQKYYAEFPSYNPHLDRLPPVRKRHPNSLTHPSSFKFYEIDGVSSAASMIRSQRGVSHNERFYEEQEFERRLRKRRARLIGATEEAFTHIKRRRDQEGGGSPLDSVEAAAAVFPSLARPLQKYLRLTRQLSWHTAESVLNHLATSLRLGLGPRAFLNKFISTPSPIATMRTGGVSSWALVSDVSVSRTLCGNTTFLLRSGEESLYVSVSRLPHFNLTEEVVDPKNNKFTLRLGSETSV